MWVDVDLRVGGREIMTSVVQLETGDRERVTSQLAWFACNLGYAPASQAPAGWDAFLQSLLDAYVRVTFTAAEFEELPEIEQHQVLATAFTAFIRINGLHPLLAHYVDLFAQTATAVQA